MWFKHNTYSISDIPELTSTLDYDGVLKKYSKRIRSTTLRLLLSSRVTVGKRSDILWRLENELISQGLNRDEVFTLIKGSAWNKFAGRKDEDRQLKREIAKIKQLPKPRMDLGPDVVRLSDVKPQTVKWLWYPYIPKGKVTLIEGDPGLGKSWLTTAIACHLSIGKRLPATKKKSSGRVLIMSAEDGIGDTIVPRLIEMKANRTRIFAYNKHIILDEIGLIDLEAQLDRIRPSVLVLDPLVAYMGSGIDLHKANETRELMANLAHLAEQYHLSIIAVRHLTKGARDKSIYRGIGSIDLTAAARSVLMVGHDPEDRTIKIICHIKSNLAPMGDSVRFRLDPGNKGGFAWKGTSKLTADDILGGNKPKSDKSIAEMFLSESLTKEGINVQLLMRNAEARGIDRNTLRRVRRQMNVRVVKREDGTYWIKD